jgi:hypothetical protein
MKAELVIMWGHAESFKELGVRSKSGAGYHGPIEHKVGFASNFLNQVLVFLKIFAAIMPMNKQCHNQVTTKEQQCNIRSLQ